MLSTLRHRRIVSYLGVCYQPHPTHGEECLFIMTEFMPGVSIFICSIPTVFSIENALPGYSEVWNRLC